MQLSRTDVSTMTPMQKAKLQELINNLHYAVILGHFGLLDASLDALDLMANEYGNRCYFCNESNTSKDVEEAWGGSVDLLINGSQRGNLICNSNKCQDEYDEYMNNLIYGDYNPQKN